METIRTFKTGKHLPRSLCENNCIEIPKSTWIEISSLERLYTIFWNLPGYVTIWQSLVIAFEKRNFPFPGGLTTPEPRFSQSCWHKAQWHTVWDSLTCDVVQKQRRGWSLSSRILSFLFLTQKINTWFLFKIQAMEKLKFIYKIKGSSLWYIKRNGGKGGATDWE